MSLKSHHHELNEEQRDTELARKKCRQIVNGEEDRLSADVIIALPEVPHITSGRAPSVIAIHADVRPDVVIPGPHEERGGENDDIDQSPKSERPLAVHFLCNVKHYSV